MRKVFGAFAEGVILRVTPSAREKHYRYLWGNMTAEGSPHKKGPSANAWVTFRKKVQETSAEGEKRTTMLEFPQSSTKFRRRGPAGACIPSLFRGRVCSKMVQNEHTLTHLEEGMHGGRGNNPTDLPGAAPGREGKREGLKGWYDFVEVPS